MVSISPIGKKIVSSIKRGLVTKKMALPQDVTLTPLKTKSANATKAKSAFSDCGGVETFCTPLITF